MPSGHAATMAAADTVIGLREGVGSPLFGLALVITALVLHDAVRLRWSVGEQAVRINKLLAAAGREAESVVVWRGHRIREVAAGSLLGSVVAALLYIWWF
jgi:acid phosphatase family membrane protein YuiD